MALENCFSVMRGMSVVSVAALFIVKLQPVVGFLPIVLQIDRGIVGLVGFLGPAAGEMELALVQQGGGNGLVKVLPLGGEKSVVLPQSEPAGGVFTEKALFVLGDVAAAPGTGADALLAGGKQHLAAGDRGTGRHQLPHHGGDGLHEVLRGQFPPLHLFQPVFPLRRQQRGLQHLRQDGDEGIALLGGDETGDLLGLFPLHKAGFHQFFQDGGAGGRSPDALALYVIGHILYARRLHAFQDGIFGVGLGRGRLACLDPNSVHRQGRALGQTVRENRVLLVLSVGPPAQVQHLFSLGGEAVTAAVHRHGSLGIAVGRADCPEQGPGHQPEDFMLPRGQAVQVGLGGGPGGDNGVVVGDFAAVADLIGQHRLRLFLAAEDGGDKRQGRDAPGHVRSQIAAVGPGVGDELFLIEGLEISQSLDE